MQTQVKILSTEYGSLSAYIGHIFIADFFYTQYHEVQILIEEEVLGMSDFMNKVLPKLNPHEHKRREKSVYIDNFEYIGIPIKVMNDCVYIKCKDEELEFSSFSNEEEFLNIFKLIKDNIRSIESFVELVDFIRLYFR